MAATPDQPGLVLQHSDDAPPALLGAWFERERIPWRVVDVPGDGLPAIEAVPWLVVLGSHRSVNDARPAWIPAEVELLGEAIERGVPTLGICFGGQALALALGGEVRPSPVREASWDSAIEILDRRIPPGPWLNFHLEGFTLPPAATLLARTRAGPSAFAHGPHVAVQFHPEVTPAIADAWASDYRARHRWIDAEGLRRAGAELPCGAGARAFELFRAWWRGAAGGVSIATGRGTGRS